MSPVGGCFPPQVGGRRSARKGSRPAGRCRVAVSQHPFSPNTERRPAPIIATTLTHVPLALWCRIANPRARSGAEAGREGRRHLFCPSSVWRTGMARHQTEPATLTAHHDREFREVLDRVGDKWSLLVIAMLEESPTRRAGFSELKRRIPGISQRMVTATLRSLAQRAPDARRLCRGAASSGV